MIQDAVLSALLNLLLFGGLPFLAYFTYQSWRRQRGAREIFQRAGLQVGEVRYLAYSLALTAAGIAALIVWPPQVEPFTRQGSPQRAFVGLGLGAPAITMALLYGVVKTGLPEELLFRGLIAGSLSRRLPLAWANAAQALIFFVPHLLVLLIMPEVGMVLPLVFLGALVAGWVRIKSGSILGPWLMHGGLNVATCLSVAARSMS